MISWIVQFFSTRRLFKTIIVALAALGLRAPGTFSTFSRSRSRCSRTAPHHREGENHRQYITHSYYDECVVDYTKDGDSKPTFVLVGRGTVYAGFDLQKLDKDRRASCSGATPFRCVSPSRRSSPPLFPPAALSTSTTADKRGALRRPEKARH